MKQIFKISILLIFAFLWVGNLKAQTRFTFDNKPIRGKAFIALKQSVEDSLYKQIDNAIYRTYYNPSYMRNKTPVFTMLKIDIDWDGKVTGMNFSDSADSTFVKAWVNNSKYHDVKETFERYAKVKAYKNISLLIPIAYETDLPNSNKYYTNDYLESYLKFGKKNFIGTSVMLSPIIIPVLTSGNE